MWIRRERYYELLDKEILYDSLEREIQRLGSQITEKTTDCNIGAWCGDCIHRGFDQSRDWSPRGLAGLSGFAEIVGGKVTYCKKHLHEICPEFEINQKE